MAEEKNWYGTKQIAAILDIPEWRVKNFSEGAAYGLPPSALPFGKGRGSRRLYTFRDLLRFAIADELVHCGFTPEDVGKAVREIPESRLTSWTEEWVEGHKRAQLPLLVNVHGEWRVRKLAEVKRLTSRVLSEDDWRGLFILNFPSLLESVVKRMTELEAQGKLPGGKQG
jgi:DNA-binding transcriptional MerR regulator